MIRMMPGSPKNLKVTSKKSEPNNDLIFSLKLDEFVRAEGGVWVCNSLN